MNLLEFARINQFRSLICQNIKLVPKFNRRLSNPSLRLISPLVRLMCQSACCAMMSMCHSIIHVYKDHFDGNVTNFTFNFSLSIFSVFPLLPLFYLSSSHFIHKKSNQSLTLLLPVKTFTIFISPKSSSSSSIRWKRCHFEGRFCRLLR